MDAPRGNEVLMTPEEVAARLRVSEGTVSQWVKERKLPVVKVGSLNRFRPSDIDEWIEANSRPVGPAPVDSEVEGDAA